MILYHTHNQIFFQNVKQNLCQILFNFSPEFWEAYLVNWGIHKFITAHFIFIRAYKVYNSFRTLSFQPSRSIVKKLHLWDTLKSWNVLLLPSSQFVWNIYFGKTVWIQKKLPDIFNSHTNSLLFQFLSKVIWCAS